MIKRYQDFLSSIKPINEETGMRNMSSLSKLYTEAEIYFHQDLDGVCSCLAMIDYIQRNGIKVMDAHIIQYGGLEFAVKNTKEGRMPVLVDFAHSKPFYVIATDHHDKQSGVAKGTSTNFKPSRSNVETISGEISPSDVFHSTDIELIKTVDSADFLRNGITPENIQNAIFNYDNEKSASRNRFLMGFVVNRTLLALKNKRITVTSLDGKRNHINKNLLECLALDSSPSLYSMFNNLRHYMNSATSLEWNMSKKSHQTPMKLATPEELTNTLMKYIDTRKEVVTDKDGNTGKHKDINYDADYKIVSQYGIGSVTKTGSYDRYVVFKNFPESEFVCTIFPMGLIQVSCNPFRERSLEDINLGEIAKEVLKSYEFQFKNINISITDIKKINEGDVEKMKKKYGDTYEAIGFTFEDLKAFYPTSIVYLPNRTKGDMKTRAILDLNDESNIIVTKYLKPALSKPYTQWTDQERELMGYLRIPIWDIIQANSGGHKAITNIQGLIYLGCRRDALKQLFRTDSWLDIMKGIGAKFVETLKAKIDLARSQKEVTYDTEGVQLLGDVNTD